jgi:hypothetical protein
MVDPAGIRRFGPPHNPSPKPRMFNIYVESGKKKKTLNWFDLVGPPYTSTSLPEAILDLTQLSAVEKLKLKVSVISGSSYLSHSSTIIFIVINQ